MRYILMDSNSGFVWDDLQAETPIDACIAADATAHIIHRDYEQFGPRDRARQRAGYFVYEAPADFPEITDGQDQKQILKVAKLNCVAFVAWGSKAEDQP